MRKFGKVLKLFRKNIRVIGLAIALAVMVASCSLWQQNKETAKVPVFLFTQAAPDGKTLGAIVPSGLVAKQGGLDKVIKSLPPQSKFNVTQFGKTLEQFDTTDLSSSDMLGPVAIFKLQAALGANSPLWREQNLTIIPTSQLTKMNGRPYQFTCPNKVQPLILGKSRPLFANLGIAADRLEQVAIASLACLDIDGDGQPEILAGLRLDNPNRPPGIDPSAWQQFLARPAIERQEFSLLAMLKNPTGQTDWQAESIITHTRALAYIGDSISSYIVFGAQDLNGDKYAELILQEIGLDTIDAQVITPSIDPKGQWQWQNYYQSNQPLNIVQ